MGRNLGHSSTVVPPPQPPSQPPPPPAATRLVPLELSDESTQEENEFTELDSSELEEMKGNDWKEVPFELQCVDGTYCGV